MSDLRTTISVNTGSAEAEVAALNREIQTLNGNLKQLQAIAGNRPSSANLQYVKEYEEQIAALEARIKSLTTSTDSLPAWYSKLARATQAAQDEQRKFTSSLAPQSIIRDHARSLEEAARATEQLSLAQNRFASQVAPQSNISSHQRNEVQALRQRAALMRDAESALRRYDVEQARASTEASKFASAIAPASRIRFVGIGEDLRAVEAGLAATGRTAGFAGNELKRIVTIGDELARHQRGQLVSTLGATLKDFIGTGTAGTVTAVGAGIAATATVATVAIIHEADALGKMARETQIAATAAAMSVTQFSELQGALQLMGLKGTEANETLRRFAVNVGAAVADPTSKAAEAFKAFGISMDVVRTHANDVNGLFNLLTKSLSNYRNDANSARALTELFGRGFEKVIPLLAQGGEGLDRAREKAHQLGIVLTDESVKALTQTADKVTALSVAIEGRVIQAFIRWKPAIDGVIDSLTRLIGVQSEEEKATSAEHFRELRTGQLRGGDTGTPTSVPYYTRAGNRQVRHPGEVIPSIDQGYDARGIAQAFQPSIGPVGTEKKDSEEAFRLVRASALKASTDASKGGSAVKENQAELAVLQAGLKDAKIVGDQRIQLTDDINRKIKEINNQNAHAGTAAAKQDYEAFAGAERRKIEDARGNAVEQKRIIVEWTLEADKAYAGQAAAHQKAINQIRAVEQEVQKQEFSTGLTSAKSGISDNAERLRIFEEDMAARVHLHEISKQNAAGYTSQAAGGFATQNLQSLRNLYNQPGLNEQQKRSVEELFSHVQLQSRETLSKLDAEWAAGWESIAKKIEKPLASAFNQIGGVFEKTLTEAITRTGTRGQAGKQLAQGLVGGGVHLVGDVASQGAAQLVGGSAGQGLGEVIAQKLVSFVTDKALDVGKDAAVYTSAITAPLIAAQEANTTTIVAAISANTIAAQAKPSILGTTYSMGGIVPSAAGGMVLSGAGGAQLAVLHTREMVLPANISDHILQSMGGPANGNTYSSQGDTHLTYAPTMNGGQPFQSRTSADNFFRAHGNEMMKMVNYSKRNGFKG